MSNFDLDLKSLYNDEISTAFSDVKLCYATPIQVEF